MGITAIQETNWYGDDIMYMEIHTIGGNVTGYQEGHQKHCRRSIEFKTRRRTCDWCNLEGIHTIN